MSRYSWGVDGYGRAHICERYGRTALFCMLPGYHGSIGVFMLDEQQTQQPPSGAKREIKMNHVELAALAASLETSIEVMEVIADKANGDKKAMMEIWSEGDKELEKKAFDKTEEDELNWGEQTIYRNKEG